MASAEEKNRDPAIQNCLASIPGGSEALATQVGLDGLRRLDFGPESEISDDGF